MILTYMRVIKMARVSKTSAYRKVSYTSVDNRDTRSAADKRDRQRVSSEPCARHDKCDVEGFGRDLDISRGPQLAPGPRV